MKRDGTMEDEKFANAYKQVLVILNDLNKEDYVKIPIEYINFLEESCNKNYKFEYDSTKSLEELDLLQETKFILFKLFEEFGTTEKQKDKINKYRQNYYFKLNEKKKEKYNYDDMFKNKKEVEIKEKNIKEYSSNLPVEVKKKNKLFKNVLIFFENIFRKK